MHRLQIGYKDSLSLKGLDFINKLDNSTSSLHSAGTL